MLDVRDCSPSSLVPLTIYSSPFHLNLCRYHYYVPSSVWCAGRLTRDLGYIRQRVWWLARRYIVLDRPLNTTIYAIWSRRNPSSGRRMS